MNNYCTFYIVRHGESEDNVKGVTSGSSNPGLSENGVNQAKERGKEFQNIPFAAVFSSDYARSKETAKLLFDGSDVLVESVKALRERAWGELEGKSKQNL